MRIYLSLPITGYNLEERMEYARNMEYAIRKIYDNGCKSDGLAVVNPLYDVTPDNVHSHEYYMAKDLCMLAKCDAIVFSPNFIKSEGCMIEYWYARMNGMKMLCMTDDGKLYYDESIYVLKDEDTTLR